MSKDIYEKVNQEKKTKSDHSMGLVVFLVILFLAILVFLTLVILPLLAVNHYSF